MMRVLVRKDGPFAQDEIFESRLQLQEDGEYAETPGRRLGYVSHEAGCRICLITQVSESAERAVVRAVQRHRQEDKPRAVHMLRPIEDTA